MTFDDITTKAILDACATWCQPDTAAGDHSMKYDGDGTIFFFDTGDGWERRYKPSPIGGGYVGHFTVTTYREGADLQWHPDGDVSKEVVSPGIILQWFEGHACSEPVVIPAIVEAIASELACVRAPHRRGRIPRMNRTDTLLLAAVQSENAKLKSIPLSGIPGHWEWQHPSFSEVIRSGCVSLVPVSTKNPGQPLWLSDEGTFHCKIRGPWMIMEWIGECAPGCTVTATPDLEGFDCACQAAVRVRATTEAVASVLAAKAALHVGK